MAATALSTVPYPVITITWVAGAISSAPRKSGETIQRRHLQIGEHHVEGLDEQAGEGSLAALRFVDVVALLAQDQRGGGAHVALIVDDEDARLRTGRRRIRRNHLARHGQRSNLIRPRAEAERGNPLRPPRARAKWSRRGPR